MNNKSKDIIRVFMIFFILLFLSGSLILLPGCFISSYADDMNDSSTSKEIAGNPDDSTSGNNPEKQDSTKTALEENEVGTDSEASNESSSNNDITGSSDGNTDMNEDDEEPADSGDVSMAAEDVDKENSEIPATTEEPPYVAPEVTLSVILGPEYAQDSTVCYYRVKASVAGNPFPAITFSKDDSNGAWGVDITQINLTEGQSYTLTCLVESTAGTAESAVVLNWIENPDAKSSSGKDQSSPAIQVDYGDVENFLIDVNLTLQQVTVSYKGNLIRSMTCSGGTPETPTPLGEYLTYQKIYYQYVPKFSQGAFYWTRFYGSYLFHGIPTDINRNMLVEEFEKLGTPASHGCIRLMNEDAKWMYDILPLGIRVNIHN